MPYWIKVKLVICGFKIHENSGTAKEPLKDFGLRD